MSRLGWQPELETGHVEKFLRHIEDFEGGMDMELGLR